jgi:hypothetical protein
MSKCKRYQNKLCGRPPTFWLWERSATILAVVREVWRRWWGAASAEGSAQPVVGARAGEGEGDSGSVRWRGSRGRRCCEVGEDSAEEGPPGEEYTWRRG